MKVLIASSNMGKVAIYGEVLKEMGLEYISLRDLDINTYPEENGKDTRENAIIKAKFYHELTGYPIVSNDSGLIIEKLSAEEQPGMFVRRLKGKTCSDKEMLEYYSKKLEEVGGESDSYFQISLAVVNEKGEIHCKDFKSYRYMVSKPCETIIKGLPLRSLDYDKKSGKYMAEMTIAEANAFEGDCIKQQANFIKSVLKFDVV